MTDPHPADAPATDVDMAIDADMAAALRDSPRARALWITFSPLGTGFACPKRGGAGKT
ncbi:MAG: hypothetical protein ACRDU4_03120 [Mycobacterium sp.]